MLGSINGLIVALAIAATVFHLAKRIALRFISGEFLAATACVVCLDYHRELCKSDILALYEADHLGQSPAADGWVPRLSISHFSRNCPTPVPISLCLAPILSLAP
jgi:hypothetical protein